MEAHKYARSTRGRGAEGKASTSRDPDELLDVPLPYILHLDPIAHGGHDTKAVGLALKQWLRYYTLPVFKLQCSHRSNQTCSSYSH